MSGPRRAWTEQEIRSLGTRTDLVTAYAIVCGGGKNRAWRAFHQGELPFPAIRVGRRVVVPVRHLLDLLAIPATEPAKAAPSRPSLSVVPDPTEAA